MPQENVIFRVQDWEGRGPWRPGFSHKWVIPRGDHGNLIPWNMEFPYIDVERLAGNIGCGCRTIKQLRRWFTRREYLTLQSMGYRAVMMNVNQVVAESDKQLVFTRLIPLAMSWSPIKLY